MSHHTFWPGLRTTDKCLLGSLNHSNVLPTSWTTGNEWRACSIWSPSHARMAENGFLSSVQQRTCMGLPSIEWCLSLQASSWLTTSGDEKLIKVWFCWGIMMDKTVPHLEKQFVMAASLRPSVLGSYTEHLRIAAGCWWVALLRSLNSASTFPFPLFLRIQEEATATTTVGVGGDCRVAPIFCCSTFPSDCAFSQVSVFPSFTS